MRVKFSFVAMAVAIGIAVTGLASPARATIVTYTTVGTFSGGNTPGTNTYLDAASGVSIVFNGIVSNSVNVPPPSSASFGSFDTSGTTSATMSPVSSGFNLDIFQTAPEVGGPLTFIGSLNGQLAIDNSQAYILFAGPLSQSIGSIIYTILSADSGTPGRLDLVPPSTNAGITTLQGRIDAVPEPTAMALLGLGAVGMLLIRHRARKANAAA